MPPSRFPIPQGTLDMLILQILSLEPAQPTVVNPTLPSALDQVLNNLKTLGTPNAYNDPSTTQALAASAMDKLQTLEFNLRKKVEKSNQLFLNGSDQAPPAFRGSVEEYYRSLAKKGGGGAPAAPATATPPVIKKGGGL